MHLPLLHQLRHHPRILNQLSLNNRFGPDGTGRTGMQAFTTGGASNRFSPWGIEVGDDPHLVAAVLDIPVMRAFYFVTHTDTTGAHDATVVIEYIPGM